MRTKFELTVVNMSDEFVTRAGITFGPKVEEQICVTGNGRAEIKACGALLIYAPGIPCDHPGCDFVGKNERSLKFHKKRMHQYNGGAEDE